MAKASFEVDRNIFEAKALQWAQQYQECCFLQSNGYSDEYASIDAILAVDASNTFKSTSDTFDELEIFKAEHPNQWMFGFFAYDLKNDIENLQTKFDNPLGFSDCYFFIPKTIIQFIGSQVEIKSVDPQQIFDQINSEVVSPTEPNVPENIKFKKRMSKEDYLEAFGHMMNHIRRGDIYEVNLCQEFYAEEVHINPLHVLKKLNSISPTPFSTYFKIKDKFILSASPERFLAKRDNTLISQPIKGTAPRGQNKEEDERIMHQLRNNPKEIAENVMIVDLVRNDLTRSAKAGTVQAERKLEVHSFKQVHQLISTITCEQAQDITDIETIKNTFPPGSMTGAPKISAMKLCDKYEKSRRGVYSGTVGYFSPQGDFDFNVIIRTLLYNQSKGYLSFHTGGALTIDADVEKEYKECLLKASGILKTFNTTL